MPSKKNKGEEEPPKPLSFYVKDRLELTKQLFSCLKSKQIKSRLPTNLQNKSMERIQQICLDEILGISSKRLLSIINNTPCPADTESDSDIEHISLSEISSEESDGDLVLERNNSKNKSNDKEKSNDSPSAEMAESSRDKPKTMLELIELEARARAIRSQLALEPVTKIELDDDSEEEVPEVRPSTGPSMVLPKAPPPPPPAQSKKPSTNSTKSSEKSSSRRIVVQKLPEKPSELTATAPKSKPSAPPVKLKRNFNKTPSDTALSTPSSSSDVSKENKEKEEKQEKITAASRTSSPDLIAMEQNISTYFISDSDDETEPPAKKKSPSKSPQKRVNVVVQEEIPSNANDAVNIIDNNTTGNDESTSGKSPAKEIQKPVEQETEKLTQQEEDDGDVVNLMSDTEIDSNINSDKEEEEEKEKSENTSKTENKKINLALDGEEEEEGNKKESEVRENPNKEDFDDDVVEILHSDSEFDSEKPASDSGKNSDESETWKQRYLRSSTVKNVLSTSKLATKVRDKLAAKKKSQEEIKKKKEKEKKEKIEMEKEKISNLEEGSLEQFQVLKESSNSNL